MLGRLKSKVEWIIENSIAKEFSNFRTLAEEDILALKLLIGKNLTYQMREHGIYDNIQDSEFSVFSQFGDDGILQYLIHQTRPVPSVFIEFGVQNYRESNTRFLLFNNNWRGLVMDSSPQDISFIKRDPWYWKYDLTAVCAFVDCSNINQLFTEIGFTGELGLLSIDIDGNDYWVWDSIHTVNPVIVTVEYNSVFGPNHAITVPYDPAFQRTKAHYSNLYWGCSLKSLCLLAEKKGYAFVGTNSNGNNAHFVRKDKLGDLPSISIQIGYTESKFRESRDEQGNLTYLSGTDRLRMIKDMRVYNVESGALETIESLFGL